MNIKRNLALILAGIILFSSTIIFGEDLDLAEELDEGIILEEELILDFSPWAESDLIDGYRFGFYDKNFYKDNSNLRKAITLESLKTLQKGYVNKLNNLEVLNPNFKGVKVEETSKREDVLKALYNEMGKYDDIKNINYISYMNENKIVVGDGKNLFLDKNATIEETILMMKRSIDYLYNKHNKASQGFLWKAENKGNTVYFFGSIHMGNDDMYPFRSKVMDSYKNSDQLYVEIDITDEEAMFEAMENLFPEPEDEYEDTTLKEVIGEELFKKLQAIFAENDENLKEDSKMKVENAIGYVNMTIMDDSFEDIETDEDDEKFQEFQETLEEFTNKIERAQELGVDNYFLEKSKAESKKIGELEKIEDQLGLLEGLFSFENIHEKLSMEDKIKVLELTIDLYEDPENKELNDKIVEILNKYDDFEEEIEITEEEFIEEEEIDLEDIDLNDAFFGELDEMFEAWRMGDIDKMKEILKTQGLGEDESLETEGLEDELLEGFNIGNLLGERDKNMAEKIDKLLQGDEGKTYFVVVGAAHYIVDGTVLDILTEKGYKIERI